MTISYNWLSDYLPEAIDPERLARILTAIGLEVEDFGPYESVKGGLRGLVIGEVLTSEKHPNADKLILTTVNVGAGEPLSIVCGAPNVAVGQKVVVAPVGATIYPINGEPVTMKVAKIRGVESHGMICAEDEIGLGSDHAGILVLPDSATVGEAAASWFHPYTDWIYEIGLTPNRMDAMSHLGVARDVCAYLSHHEKQEFKVRVPVPGAFRPDQVRLPIAVSIVNREACQRYSGVSISGVKIGESPLWLQQKLRAIGVRPINNVVDITNFILHESGQPLHAFDADAIKGKKVIVKNLAEGASFLSLDEKERKLSAEDLMICDGEGNPMCIAGVFGGVDSGVKAGTRNIFLESAWFNPVDIRKTSFRHGLRTDAAMRFEKNVDISNTVHVLKRAALLIKELAGGAIASDIIDVYPDPREKQQVVLKYHYLRKLSGKSYHPDTVRKLLANLGFEIVKEGMDDLWLAAPYSKPDIHLPADVVEEIIRIDGLDNIETPSTITISPAIETAGYKQTWQEKIAGYLVGLGFFEILTNSITNAAYYKEEELATAVPLLNNLSAELNIMRPSMLETGLEVIVHNLNRKNQDLRLFEFGKTYRQSGPGRYEEKNHLCLYITGQLQDDSWKGKGERSDLYYGKGVLSRLLQLAGISQARWQAADAHHPEAGLEVIAGNAAIAGIKSIQAQKLKAFDIKQPVFYVDLDWDALLEMVSKTVLAARELPRQLPVYRDLALVVPHSLPYAAIEESVKKIRLDRLQEMRLFDIFESEKLGAGKKSLAVSFTFLDEEKTLTDKEIDGMMNRIMTGLEKELGAEIRK